MTYEKTKPVIKMTFEEYNIVATFLEMVNEADNDLDWNDITDDIPFKGNGLRLNNSNRTKSNGTWFDIEITE